MVQSRKSAIGSMQKYRELRDALLFEDDSESAHHLSRFMNFIDSDDFLQSVIGSVVTSDSFDFETWHNSTAERASQLQGVQALTFPDNNSDEMFIRYSLMKRFNNEKNGIFDFGVLIGDYKETVPRFKSLIVRPFVSELGDMLEDAVGFARTEERDLQAVPLNRIPSEKENRIFLSHKTVDKPLVETYFKALEKIGYYPWMDEPEMPAGTNLERALLAGFQTSCAAVFFVTENFKDEKFLSTEIDYAVREKREKGNRFAIVTLLLGKKVKVPPLLANYVYKNVTNDLEGFYEIVRALPIEVGPLRWKKEVIESES